uniref:Uncharacterized protein n=1 Tax=Strombidium inclinatum TaxID=197538 RepID=A0A7S3IY48_9SPIT
MNSSGWTSLLQLVCFLVDSRHRPLVFLFFQSVLKKGNLMLEQLIEELAQIVQGDLPRVVVVPHLLEDLVVHALEACVCPALHLMPPQELSYKGFNLVNFKDSYIVSIDSIKNIFVHFIKLVVVDQDICQVLDRLLVVNLRTLVAIIL